MGKNFKITQNIEYATNEAESLIFTLGTPIDECLNPNYSQIHNVLSSIIPFLKEKQTIILRSTLAPKTTEYLKDYLEKDSSFIIGKNLFLAYCPERIAEGKALEELSEIPQLIGTFDEESAKRAENLFGKLTQKILFSDPRSVELAKLYCNISRSIQFAIANEFMMITEENYERDAHEVTHLVNEGYKRGDLASPGLTAGPCLYKDGHFLLQDTPFTDLIITAWRINEGVPAFLVNGIRKRTDLKGKKIALLGAGFKRDSDDTRYSLSFKAKKILEHEGAIVNLHDPYIKESLKVTEVLKDADVVMVATNHSFYEDLGLEGIRKYSKKNALISDVWNIFKTGKILFELEKYK
ncbi:nucleotide sugar dehydrogenase [Candidatus Pacearchaeota archaeon]|nr:MAG: nucleotide sugar dehydrogenase [Candidatus Pacearchaeota archaeon]